MRFYRVAAAERPTRLYIPDSYDPARASPLILCLHGYTNTGEWMENLVRLHPFAEEHRILLCYPDGTVDQDGNQFWNASAGCCDFYGAGVDDSTYLRNLIKSVQQTYNVDAKRIYLFGFSNGAFMAHRLARDHSDLIAAIIAAAGTMSLADTFAPSEPVSIQQIHGTLDPIDQTNGGTQADMEPYLGARETIELWADANGCSVQVEDSQPSRDMHVEIQGNDTTVVTYESYTAGGYVELLSSPVGHGMPTTPAGPQMAVDWFLAHPKP